MNAEVKTIIELKCRAMPSEYDDLYLLLGPEEENAIAKEAHARSGGIGDGMAFHPVEVCGMRVLRADGHVAGRAVLRRSAVRALAIEAGFFPLDKEENDRFLNADIRIRRLQERCASMKRQINELKALNNLANNTLKLERLMK